MSDAEKYAFTLQATDGGTSSFRIELGECQLCSTPDVVLSAHFAGEVSGDDESVGICRPCLEKIVIYLQESPFFDASILPPSAQTDGPPN